jgi:hypothetical protein
MSEGPVELHCMEVDIHVVHDRTCTRFSTLLTYNMLDLLCFETWRIAPSLEGYRRPRHTPASADTVQLSKRTKSIDPGDAILHRQQCRCEWRLHCCSDINPVVSSSSTVCGHLSVCIDFSISLYNDMEVDAVKVHNLKANSRELLFHNMKTGFEVNRPSTPAPTLPWKGFELLAEHWCSEPVNLVPFAIPGAKSLRNRGRKTASC